jgi:DNA repair protein SbcD/Mre11
MKILHTSDWHLGQKLRGNIRDAEHELVLNWLIQTIIEEQIEALIIAGDIFDGMNPPNSSRKLYYQFLAKLIKTTCRHVVIIGGNHDAPSMLEASKALLEAMNIYVIGAATSLVEDEIILLKNDDKIEAIVAAVPFLRDQDLRRSVAGEEETDIYQKIQQAIYQHYLDIGKYCEDFLGLKVPIIATGHLYASAATTNGENQDNIYMGNLENISADKFPNVFDYVALGHIHTAQPIDNHRHIRYSGSIIPLSFKEVKDTKSVTILDFKERLDIKILPVPIARQLISIQGTYAEVLEKLNSYEVYEGDFRHWLKIEVQVEAYQYGMEEAIHGLCEEKNMELIMLKQNANKRVHIEYEFDRHLHDIKPIDIFKQKCENEKMSPENAKKLENTFQELLEWMNQQEIDVM